MFFFENCSHLWKTAGVYPKISFCQTIILSEYFFDRISFCQNIVMSKFQGLVLQNLKLPKVFRKWIASFASQDHPSWAPPSHFSKTMVPLEPSPPVSVLSISLTQWICKKIPKLNKELSEANKGRWFQWNHHPRPRLVFATCSVSYHRGRRFHWNHHPQ